MRVKREDPTFRTAVWYAGFAAPAVDRLKIEFTTNHGSTAIKRNFVCLLLIGLFLLVVPHNDAHKKGCGVAVSFTHHLRVPYLVGPGRVPHQASAMTWGRDSCRHHLSNKNTAWERYDSPAGRPKLEWYYGLSFSQFVSDVGLVASFFEPAPCLSNWNLGGQYEVGASSGVRL